MKNFLRFGAHPKRMQTALQLHIGKDIHEFKTPACFESFLADYETIPQARARQFFALDKQALNQQLIVTQRACRGCKDLLLMTSQHKTPLKTVWHMLESNPEPEDHDWSSILFELDGLPESMDAFRRIALECYSQYLVQRSEALGLALRKCGTSVKVDEDRGEGASTISGSTFIPPQDRSRSRAGIRRTHYQRLPRRQSVTMSLRSKPDIQLLLAEHSVKIMLDSGVATLMDRNGARYVLRSGRNLVGRAMDCDVCIPTGRNDISRRHAVIEVLPEFQLRITDISSRGTYLHS